MILLASVSSGILAIWPNRERRRAWTIADRRGCPVVRLTSSFRTWWYHLIPNRASRRSKFCKFLDLEIVRSIWPLTLEVTDRTPLILHEAQ